MSKSTKSQTTQKGWLKKNVARRSAWLVAGLSILVVVSFLLGIKFKGLVVVAMVNGEPIYSWQYIQHLISHYGFRSLDDLIAEKLLNAEATKFDLNVSVEETNSQIDSLREEYGGQQQLNEEIKKQGFTYEQFTEAIRIQLLIDKLLEKRVSITDREIEAFIRQNQLQMQATDEAGLRKEAESALKSEKIVEDYRTLFPELKQAASIQWFINF